MFWHLSGFTVVGASEVKGWMLRAEPKRKLKSFILKFSDSLSD